MRFRGGVDFLWWLMRRQAGRVAQAGLYGVAWMVTLALSPWPVSQAIDRGLVAHRPAALIGWSAAVFGLGAAGAALGAMRHRTMTRIRLDAALRTADVVLDHTTRLGAALPARVTAGEVVTIGAGDIWTIARSLTFVGPGLGGLAGYTVVAVLLFRISPVIAAVALSGVPVLALVLGPLLRRGQAAGQRYREQQGELAGRLTDILDGLRVLGGLGGKAAHAARYRRESDRLRDEGYRVAAVFSWVEALAAGLPLLLVAAVTWPAARQAAAGALTAGELVAVYSSVAILVLPVGIFIESAATGAHGVVAGRRVAAFLALPAEDPGGRDAPPGPAALHDPESGVTVAAHGFTALAAAADGTAAAVVDRLGRYAASDATWGGIPLADIARDPVRDRILVADPHAALFAGPLREVVAGRSAPDDAAVRRAVHAAAADDLAGDLAAPVEWAGRTLSGGQRQRVRLARALYADPEMLLAVDPTSAVDAHTETAVAERTAAARAGRGTLIVTTSPVLLDRADTVHYLQDGRVAATGTHRELMATCPGYRALVVRDGGGPA